MRSKHHPLSYAEKRVVVTGGASGIGRETARLLSSLGARVEVLDLHDPRLDGVEFQPVDLRAPESIDEAVGRITGSDDPLDRLFSCAGISHLHPDLDVMRVNWLGLRHLTDALVPHMREGAAITSIASIAGLGWQANISMISELLGEADFDNGLRWCTRNAARIRAISVYVLSKQSIIVWTQATASELARRRIRTNCILPGPTATGMMPELIRELGQAHYDAFPKPLTGRMMSAEEQAWPLIALGSDELRIVNGAVLPTDEGFAAAAATRRLDAVAVLEG